MADYTILVCPICGEQGENDYEYGAFCVHQPYGEVELIEIPAEPVNLRGYMGLAQLRLQQEQREKDFAAAERAWFQSLPKEERERIREEQLSKLAPIDRMRVENQEAMAVAMRRMAMFMAEPRFVYQQMKGPAE